ncbi:MAG: EVE domain-containing protein, partial [Gemmatimonadetes bacterium]|nr:EVE domain-containing protein [Gemmatimonadota bacterium]
YDAKSTPDDPRWFSVDVKWKKAFKTYVHLKDLKANPALKEMLVVRRGQRLSIQPVKKSEFEVVSEMGGA